MIDPFVVIIPSAGTGERFESSLPKQYHKINGKFVLDHSLNLFLSFEECKKIVVAISESDELHADLIKDERIVFVQGGSKRAISVKNCFDYLLSEGFSDDVLVHDSARPCLRKSIVLDFLDNFSSTDCGGMIFASRSNETLKFSSDGKVIDHTQDRSVMWNAQTPQIFRSKRLQHAYENFSGDYSNVTDEAAIFDEIEDDVVLYENSSNNLKITLSDDLKLAEFMMKEKDL